MSLPIPYHPSWRSNSSSSNNNSNNKLVVLEASGVPELVDLEDLGGLGD